MPLGLRPGPGVGGVKELHGLFACKLPGAKDTICYLQRLKDINLLPFSFFFPFSSIAATTHCPCHSETEVAIGWISGQRPQKDSNLSHPSQPSEEKVKQSCSVTSV